MFALAQPLLCAAMFDMPLPAPMRPSRLSAVPVLTGGDTSNLLFGKIQRHATLPGSRLSPNPLAAVDDQVPAPPAVALPTLTLTSPEPSPSRSPFTLTRASWARRSGLSS